MAFNIGDMVYIRPHTHAEKEQYNIPWDSQMDLLEDRVATVRRIDGNRYLVKDCFINAWFLESSLKSIITILTSPKFSLKSNFFEA